MATVEDTKELNRFTAQTIGDDEGRSANDQFPRTRHASRTSSFGESRQYFYGFKHEFNLPLGCGKAVERDIVSN